MKAMISAMVFCFSFSSFALDMELERNLYEEGFSENDIETIDRVMKNSRMTCKKDFSQIDNAPEEKERGMNTTTGNGSTVINILKGRLPN